MTFFDPPRLGAQGIPVSLVDRYCRRMSPQFALPLMETVKRWEPVQQRLVLAWLRRRESDVPACPGVLLNSDAVLVKISNELLTRSVASLEIVVETADGLGSPLPVAEVKQIRGGSSTAGGVVTAMLRLAAPADVDVTSTIDRAYWVELRDSEDFWQVAARIGLVPGDLDTLMPPVGLQQVPHAAPVLPLITEARMSWCDIFWWLC